MEMLLCDFDDADAILSHILLIWVGLQPRVGGR